VETWATNAVAALIGVVVALVDGRDYVAMLYPLRALVLCGVIVGLVVRWEGKSRAAVRGLG